MALIPFDVALGGLNSIAGIFGANEQDRQRQRQMEEAARQRAKALDILARQSNEAFMDFQKRQQAGEFDPTKALERVRAESALNLQNALGGSMTSLRNLGYKPGDSAIEMATKGLTSEALLGEQAQRLATEQAFQDRQQAAQNYLRQIQGQEASARMGLGGQMMSEGMATPERLGSTIQGIIQSGLPGQIKEALAKKPSTQTTTGTNPKAYAPQSLAAGLEQFRNIRLSGVPNRFGS